MENEQLLGALKAIAHPSRLLVMQALAEGETNVGDIEKVTGISQPTLSQQLAILRKAGLVETRRQAKLIYYSLHAEVIGDVARALAAFAPASARPEAEPGGRRPASGVANSARLHI